MVNYYKHINNFNPNNMNTIERFRKYRKGGILKCGDGDSIQKDEDNILKRIYYWRSPEYEGTFDEAYTQAKQNKNSDFWWNGNIYNSDFKYVENPYGDYNKLRYDYIQAIENHGLEGFNEKTQIWRPPKKQGFDPNQIGIGLDMTTNTTVKNFLKKNGRTKDPWLTHDEMIKLQQQRFDELEKVIDRRTKGVKLSNQKRAMLMGLLYHGFGPFVWTPNGPKTRAIHNALFKGKDSDLIEAISNFYNGSYTDRYKHHKEFWNK